MAVKQKGAPRQPPEAAQPEQAADTAPDTQLASGAQAQQAQQAQQTEQMEQTAGAEPSFSDALAQQVAQAIQPVLDDFRQQVTQTFQHQTEALSEAGATAPSEQPSAPESRPAQSAAPESQQQPSGQTAGADQPASLAPSAVTEALRPVLKTVERDGKEWLQAMLVAGLTILLSEATRAPIQQRAEQGIHSLTQKAFEAAPGGAYNQEMQAKTEYALQTILHGTLDEIFGQGIRAVVQRSGQAAIQESFHGDFSAALSAVVDALKAIVEALINVIREQWQMLLRLALAIVALAIASALKQDSNKRREPKTD